MLEVATMEFLPYVIGKNKFHPHLYVQSKQIVTKWDEDSSGWLLLEPVSIWSDTVQDYADFFHFIFKVSKSFVMGYRLFKNRQRRP